jgi:hypothetical protein
VLQALRPLPDIVAAFSRRIAALGTTPPPPEARTIDYLSVLDDARPRTSKPRKSEDRGALPGCLLVSSVGGRSRFLRKVR